MGAFSVPGCLLKCGSEWSECVKTSVGEPVTRIGLCYAIKKAAAYTEHQRTWFRGGRAADTTLPAGVPVSSPRAADGWYNKLYQHC